MRIGILLVAAIGYVGAFSINTEEVPKREDSKELGYGAKAPRGIDFSDKTGLKRDLREIIGGLKSKLKSKAKGALADEVTEELLNNVFVSLKKSDLITNTLEESLTNDKIRGGIVSLLVEILEADVIPFKEIFVALKNSGLVTDIVKTTLTDPDIRYGITKLFKEFIIELISSDALKETVSELIKSGGSNIKEAICELIKSGTLNEKIAELIGSADLKEVISELLSHLNIKEKITELIKSGDLKNLLSELVRDLNIKKKITELIKSDALKEMISELFKSGALNIKDLINWASPNNATTASI